MTYVKVKEKERDRTLPPYPFPRKSSKVINQSFYPRNFLPILRNSGLKRFSVLLINGNWICLIYCGTASAVYNALNILIILCVFKILNPRLNKFLDLRISFFDVICW